MYFNVFEKSLKIFSPKLVATLALSSLLLYYISMLRERLAQQWFWA